MKNFLTILSLLAICFSCNPITRDCNFDAAKYGYKVVSTKSGKWTAIDKDGYQAESKGGMVVYDDSCMVKGHLRKWQITDSINSADDPVIPPTFFDTTHVICGKSFKIVNCCDNEYIKIVNASEITGLGGISNKNPCFKNLEFLKRSYYIDNGDLLFSMKGKDFGPSATERGQLIISSIKKCKCNQ